MIKEIDSHWPRNNKYLVHSLITGEGKKNPEKKLTYLDLHLKTKEIEQNFFSIDLYLFLIKYRDK